MCGGCYAPPLALIPLILVVEAVAGIGKGIRNVDEAIKANNLKMIELIKKKKYEIDNAASNSLEGKSTVSIHEIKRKVELMNDQDKKVLAKLLIQRCTARLEQQAFDLAKEDLVEAFSLMKLGGEEEQLTSSNSSSSFLNNFYLAEYLMGICCYGMGEFKEAAHHFQKSIEHREQVERQLVNHQNSEKELEDLEEQFFSMQLEAKKPIEKVAASWTRNVSLYSTSVTNFTNKAKNFYNHNLMLGTDKPLLKTKPNTHITLELLYIRAGVSYYNGTYYSDAVEYFNRAIELGESYQSEHVESSYYNRGLCYYYLGELQLALDDFSKSISLMPLLNQRDAVYLMRAATYGRLGMTKEKKNDENKAYLINPFAKPLPLFHLRLLNEDNLSHIMSFLQTKHLLVMSSLCKYTRGLVKKYLQENDVEISYAALVNSEKKNTNSIVKSLFLPKKETPNTREIFYIMLNHPFLTENAKNLIVLESEYYFGGNTSIQVDTISKFQNLKRLTITYYSDIKRILPLYSPDLEFLEIVANSHNKYELTRLFASLPKLKHLRLGVTFTSNPFEKCKNLQIVEYQPIEEEQTQAHPTMTWEEIKEMNPHIIFKEYCERSLFESVTYPTPKY